MAHEEPETDAYIQEDHQVAYIFDPDHDNARKDQRSAKRRRVGRQGWKKLSAADQDDEATPSLFVPLLNGAESRECVRLRERLFRDSWDGMHERIQAILRDSNSATLEEVRSFVDEANTELDTLEDHIPSAFIITGPNIASQELLFEQLSESLQKNSPSKFVGLRSSEASSLKATLKKIVREVTRRTAEGDGDDLSMGTEKDGRRYLDYDLEALYAFIKSQPCDHVFVAFQDSEGFDSSLLSELIHLFSTWRPRIPFTLLFGVATSVDLLQARLLKSACRLIHGAQFDVVQTETILETVFKRAVAAADVPIVLGAPLLRTMLDRQRNQVAGIQAFISSVKYAYMCHFYANPLSLLIETGVKQKDVLQSEHFEAMRNTTSFRHHVESAVENAAHDNLEHARLLIEDDTHLHARAKEVAEERQRWKETFLRALLIVEMCGSQGGSFSQAYVDALPHGIVLRGGTKFASTVKQLESPGLATMLRSVIGLLKDGDTTYCLEPGTSEAEVVLLRNLEDHLAQLDALQTKADAEGFELRSKYSGRGKVMRTTVIAQKVQLSQDSADLREEDRQLTEMLDGVADLLAEHVDVGGPSDVLLSESWLYDSRSPTRDVFVPRLRAAFERSLGRPFDYLACACCVQHEEGHGGGMQRTLPPTAILYQLYLEAGSLINVADLWSSFFSLVSAGGGEEEEEEKDDDEGDDAEGGEKEENEERKVLVLFYQGLAELRALGYVKASKKRADHVAKLKWL